MIFNRTERFKRVYKKLNPKQQQIIKKAIEKMAQDLTHPSLRVKRIKSTPDIWEASASNDLRITFQRDGKSILLRNCGA